MLENARRFGATLVSVAGLLLSIACGSEPQAPLAPSAVEPTRGATVRGVVDGASTGAAAGVSALASVSLRVSVVGTSLSTVTSAAGEFVLEGVPTGKIELRFEGPGIDARLEISGLQAGQEVRITVRINGNQASLIPAATATPSPSPRPSPDDEVEFRGRLESISGATLVVSGRTVLTDGGTVVRRRGASVGFAALQVGQDLEVEGTPVAGGILARKITIEDGDDDRDQDEDEAGEVEFKGRIDSISGSTLVVSGRAVTTDASTRVLDDRGNPIALGALRVGDRVEVEGRQQGAAVLARKIKKEDDEDDD